MEQQGTPLVPLVELDDLRDLAKQPGPFLTIYLPLAPANEELAKATGLRWRALRAEAEGRGVPSGLLEAADVAIEGIHRTGPGACLIATERDRVPHIEHLPTLTDEVLRWQDVPALVPLIESRQAQQPMSSPW